MNKAVLKLVNKFKMTDDVFELKYEYEGDFEILPGQFTTFVLRNEAGKKVRRAYSIANKNGNILTFVIKRLENGMGGSKLICDMHVGADVEAVLPLGDFVLQSGDKSKLFIGTGTGFAPLYFQILESLKRGDKSKIHYIFGIRFLTDVFYEDILENIKAENPNFSYQIYLSKDSKEGFETGYVTSFLTKENTEDFEEFYICGSPNMVTESKEKLKNLGKENIYSEEF